MATSREFSYPFRIDANGGIATTRSREEVLRNHVISVLGTQPTERGMRPSYGCNLQRYAFRTDDPALLAEMQDAAAKSLEEWCPEAVFIDLSITPPSQSGYMTVEITYADATDPTNARQNTTIQLAIQGEAGNVTEVS